MTSDFITLKKFMIILFKNATFHHRFASYLLHNTLPTFLHACLLFLLFTRCFLYREAKNAMQIHLQCPGTQSRKSGLIKKAAFSWRSCLKLMLSTGNMILSSVTKANISNRPPNPNMHPFKGGQFTVKGDGASLLQLIITKDTKSKLLVLHQIATTHSCSILLLQETHHTNSCRPVTKTLHKWDLSANPLWPCNSGENQTTQHIIKDNAVCSGHQVNHQNSLILHKLSVDGLKRVPRKCRKKKVIGMMTMRFDKCLFKSQSFSKVKDQFC